VNVADAHALGRHLAHRIRRREALHQHQRRTRRHGLQRHRGAEDRKVRHRQEDHVVRTQAERLRGPFRVADEGAVREADPLRLSHRPRGVQDREERIGVARRGRRSAQVPAPSQEIRVRHDPVLEPEVLRADGDDGPDLRHFGHQLAEPLEEVAPVVRRDGHGGDGLGVAQLVLELRESERGIERHHRGAEPRAGEERRHRLGAVRQDGRDAVATSDPDVRERGRQRLHLAIHLRIRQPPVAKNEERTLRASGYGSGECVRQMLCFQGRSFN